MPVVSFILEFNTNGTFYIQNIKINNNHATGIEETSVHLLYTLIPVDQLKNDTGNQQQDYYTALITSARPTIFQRIYDYY